jgi:hypothetical protein
MHRHLFSFATVFALAAADAVRLCDYETQVREQQFQFHLPMASACN